MVITIIIIIILRSLLELLCLVVVKNNGLSQSIAKNIEWHTWSTNAPSRERREETFFFLVCREILINTKISITFNGICTN